MATWRYALVSGNLDTIRRYLPNNYTANVLGTFDRRVLITGHDEHGWTLDGYVIPRLASGLYFAREVDADERNELLNDAMNVDLIEIHNLRGVTAPDF